MPELSPRLKESIKTALAVVLAYWIALSMDWAKPHWAAIGVVTINVTSNGISLLRGTLRAGATFAGGFVALVLIALYPQDRWSYMLAASLVLAVCSYYVSDQKNVPEVMFAFVTGITFIIVACVVIEKSSRGIFNSAWLRTVQTAMGCLTYVLVATVLWPRNSLKQFEATAGKLCAVHRRLYAAFCRRLRGEGAGEDILQLRADESKLLGEARMLESAAETDSYEVWELRAQWRRYLDLSSRLIESYELLCESVDDVQDLELESVLPNLGVVCEEIERRLAAIEQMIARKAPSGAPRPVALAVDEARMRSLSGFQRAAVAVTRERVERMEALSYALYDCLADIRRFERPAARPAPPEPPKRWRGINTDHIRLIFVTVASWWIGFLIWILVYDIPAGVLFPMMVGIYGLCMSLAPMNSVSQHFWSWVGGALWTGPFYILVMQHLSGFGQLGPMIFFAIFVVHYLLWDDKYALLRTFAMVSFVLMLSVENEQSYDLTHWLLWTLWITMAIAIALATTYIVGSPRPDKMFLRLLGRFFRQCEYLLSTSAQDPGLLGRLRGILYRGDLTALALKVGLNAQQIDPRLMPGTTPEELQTRLEGLYTLAHWVKDLSEARGAARSVALRSEIQLELQKWHGTVEAWLERPHAPSAASARAREQLAAGLAGLEARLNETAEDFAAPELGPDERRSLYRLLSSYRGLTKAILAYEARTAPIDWARLQEARF